MVITDQRQIFDEIRWTNQTRLDQVDARVQTAWTRSHELATQTIQFLQEWGLEVSHSMQPYLVQLARIPSDTYHHEQRDLLKCLCNTWKLAHAEIGHLIDLMQPLENRNFYFLDRQLNQIADGIQTLKFQARSLKIKDRENAESLEKSCQQLRAQVIEAIRASEELSDCQQFLNPRDQEQFLQDCRLVQRLARENIFKFENSSKSKSAFDPYLQKEKMISRIAIGLAIRTLDDSAPQKTVCELLRFISPREATKLESAFLEVIDYQLATDLIDDVRIRHKKSGC